MLGGIGDIFHIFGVSFIGCLTGFIGYLIITNSNYTYSIHNSLLPTVIFIIIGILVGRLFMGLYAIVADSILIIFTIDEEISKYHGGST
jgi:hypothetical protein